MLAYIFLASKVAHQLPRREGCEGETVAVGHGAGDVLCARTVR